MKAVRHEAAAGEQAVEHDRASQVRALSRPEVAELASGVAGQASAEGEGLALGEPELAAGGLAPSRPSGSDDGWAGEAEASREAEASCEPAASEPAASEPADDYVVSDSFVSDESASEGFVGAIELEEEALELGALELEGVPEPVESPARTVPPVRPSVRAASRVPLPPSKRVALSSLPAPLAAPEDARSLRWALADKALQVRRLAALLGESRRQAEQLEQRVGQLEAELQALRASSGS